MVLDFTDIKKEDVMTAGGKGSNLGEMTQAGITVPGGFVVTAKAYRAYLKENHLQELAHTELSKAGNDEEKLLTFAERFRKLIQNGKISKEVEEEIRRKYEALGRDIRVAVRSSATAEDLPDASFAGQQETYLNVQGIEQVLTQVRNCYASLWGNRAVCYRNNQGFDQCSVALAVVVQQMVESEKAGVLFTINPVNQKRDEIQINSSYGLGESVVSGRVTADSYLCDKSGKILSCQAGCKKTQIVYDLKDTKEIPVSKEKQEMLSLNEKEVHMLCREGVRVEQHYGCPMDIEWAICGGQVYILQARAITTLAVNHEEEEKLITSYLEHIKIKGVMRSNLSFLLEKMPYAYRPLDYDYMTALNCQKSKIFSEYGVVLSSNSKIDEDGIQVLPDSKIKINARIVKMPGGIRLLKNDELCAKECRRLMEQYSQEVESIKDRKYDDMSLKECGEFLMYSHDLLMRLMYDRFKYAVFPTMLAKNLEKAVKR